ncbi:MAG: phage holin family protein [Vulcanimicrobiota bacterium]
MKVLLSAWVVNFITLYIVARLIPGIEIENLVPHDGFITTQGATICLIGAAIIGIFNALLKPVLNFFSLPLTCLTLGLFTFVVTGFVFWLASLVTPGFTVHGFGSAILGGVIFGVLNSLIGGLLGVEKEEKKND